MGTGDILKTILIVAVLIIVGVVVYTLATAIMGIPNMLNDMWLQINQSMSNAFPGVDLSGLPLEPEVAADWQSSLGDATSNLVSAAGSAVSNAVNLVVSGWNNLVAFFTGG